VGVSELPTDYVSTQVSLRVGGGESVQSFFESDEFGQVFVYDYYRIILVVLSLR
jgi:hypothetical protein